MPTLYKKNRARIWFVSGAFIAVLFGLFLVQQYVQLKQENDRLRASPGRNVAWANGRAGATLRPLQPARLSLRAIA